jgi:hypothetical protein
VDDGGRVPIQSVLRFWSRLIGTPMAFAAEHHLLDGRDDLLERVGRVGGSLRPRFLGSEGGREFGKLGAKYGVSRGLQGVFQPIGCVGRGPGVLRPQGGGDVGQSGGYGP